MKEEIFKERNELAKQLMIHQGFDVQEAINTAEEFMGKIHGFKCLDDCDFDLEFDKQEGEYGISVYEKDGKKWVRVKTYGHDFLIGIHDLEKDGKTEFKWQEACDVAKEQGYTLPNREQFAIISAYKDEIYKKMVEAGGEEMTGWYWSVARYYSYASWLYNGDHGILSIGNMYSGLSSRALAYPND